MEENNTIFRNVIISSKLKICNDLAAILQQIAQFIAYTNELFQWCKLTSILKGSLAQTV